jgi:uncharacterized protein YndB with AHSA1/START domain
MAEQETSERSVEREIQVPATREETWQALTDPERLGDWLAEEAELDLRPGGDLVVRTDGETREGFFEEVSEPERLVFWWGEPDAELTRVQVELEEIDEGTRVRVLEARPLVSVEAVTIAGEFGLGGTAPQMSASMSIVA